MEYVTLNNGVKMPILNFGVYQIPQNQTKDAVLTALKIGYRGIDTAQSFDSMVKTRREQHDASKEKKNW